jgi:hypothetical protein
MTDARMAKSADAADLKSADPKGLWEFKSPSGHHLIYLVQTSAHCRSLGDKSNHLARFRLSQMATCVLHRHCTNTLLSPALHIAQIGSPVIQADAKHLLHACFDIFTAALFGSQEANGIYPLVMWPALHILKCHGACNFHQVKARCFSIPRMLTDNLAKWLPRVKLFLWKGLVSSESVCSHSSSFHFSSLCLRGLGPRSKWRYWSVRHSSLLCFPS